jgi:hypothetical protein
VTKGNPVHRGVGVEETLQPGKKSAYRTYKEGQRPGRKVARTEKKNNQEWIVKFAIASAVFI